MVRCLYFSLTLLLSLTIRTSFAESERPPVPEGAKPRSATYPFDRSKLLEFDRLEVCRSPTQSPNCVAKTAWGCQFPSASSIDCGRIGLFISPSAIKQPDNIAQSRSKYPYVVPKQHWRFKWIDLGWLRSTEFCSLGPMLLRTVDAKRFDADPPLRPELIGTHEMIIYAGQCKYSTGAQVGMSVFMKQVDQEWQATSYTFNGYNSVFMAEQILGRENQWVLRGATQHWFDQCEDYGCGGSGFPHADDGVDVSARLTKDECIGKMCAYRALGIQKPVVPIDEGSYASEIRPIFLPGFESQCLGDNHPMCRW